VKITVYEKNITKVIEAHSSSLSQIALNFAGTILATASDKGTLIRLFETVEGKPIQELRRGTDKAEIYSISFDKLSNYIACSSDKGTIHIFAVTKSEGHIALSDENAP
jgi:WD repeat-containing protein 45